MLKNVIFKGNNSFFSGLTILEIYSNYKGDSNELLITFRGRRGYSSESMYSEHIRAMFIEKGKEIPTQLVKDYIEEIQDTIGKMLVSDYIKLINLDKIIQDTLKSMPDLLDYKGNN